MSTDGAAHTDVTSRPWTHTSRRLFVVGLTVGLVASSLLHALVSVSRSSADDTKPSAPLHLRRPATSHDELNRQLAATSAPTAVQFKDELYHKDDVSVAAALTSHVRVLCWVMTSADNLDKKAAHVRDTWAKRCNRVLFVSDYENATFPTVNISVPHGRDHLTMKTMLAFDYIYKNHRDEADWFLKTDDDTYVIVENLRHLLSPHKPSEPIYFGHHFKTIVKQGYFSGGAGYALSGEALRRLAGRPPGLCSDDHGAEDVAIGRCMQSLGVRVGDSYDGLRRSRFHCFPLATHLQGGYPAWYRAYDSHGAHQGISSVSDYPITFHYISPKGMYEMEYFFYHARVYGVIGGVVDVNVAPRKATERPRTNTTARPGS